MKSLIVSLNFNPGHFSHLIANYKLFKEMGMIPTLFIHPLFDKMDAENKFNKIHALSEIKLPEIKVVVFWFPSIKNIFQILKLKIYSSAKIIYVYHEPFDSIKNYYSSGFGFLKVLRIILINLINVAIVRLSDKIILPSDKAFYLYKSKYTLVNNNFYYVPLLFDDENEKNVNLTKKQYISYIGTIAEDHAFDEFLKFLKISIKHNYFPQNKFLIATKSVLSKQIKEELLKISGFKIKIIEGKPLSNENINECYENSIVVWNAYHRSLQSGVLPKAFMFGTPIIALKKNKNEFINNNENAILINNNNNVEEIKMSIEKIIQNLSYFSENARNTFLTRFYYKNYIKIFNSIINE